MIEAIFGKPGTEQYRVRLGFLLLAVGLLLMVWAWGSWIFRESVPAKAQLIVRTQSGETPGADGSEDADRRAEAAQALPLALAVSLVLVLLVLFGSYALVRAARRHRAALERRRAAPTDTTDVWAMHRLPEGAEDEWE